MAPALAVALVLSIAADSGAAQAPISNRCFTPRFWCWLQTFAPVGRSCYCGSPAGPVAGVVR